MDVKKQLTQQGKGRDVVTVTAADSDDYVFEVTANNVTISGFNITGAEKCGVYLDSSSGNTISDNEITDNGDDGIYLDSDSSGNAIHFNNIVGNSPYGVHNEAEEMVAAQNNWWGDASGPSGVGHGTGDAVSDNVEYSPWLNAPYPDGEPVFFTGVKEEDVTDGTLDAKTEADTEVVVDGSATVTAAKYSDNPRSGFSEDIGKYIDIHIDDEDVTQLEIRLYYTDAEIAVLDESSLRLQWWNGTAWVICSPDAGVNEPENYMWAKIRATDTISRLSDLIGAVFGGSGSAPSPPLPVGGEAYPVNKLAYIETTQDSDIGF